MKKLLKVIGVLTFISAIFSVAMFLKDSDK